MKALFLSAITALLLSACATPMEDDLVPADAMAPAGMSAATYVPMAASGDLFEIESSRLALQRACDPSVRSFAQMLINDHTRMSNMLMQAASSAGLPPPPMQLMPQHQEMLQRLQMAGPEGFDAAYRNEQVMAHQQALELHRTYADTGDVPALRTVASQAVGPIEMHLRTAKTLPTSTVCGAPAATQPVRRAGERG